jgi:hypothetical protein
VLNALFDLDQLPADLDDAVHDPLADAADLSLEFLAS